MRKRQRTLDMHPGNVAPADNQAHPGQAPAPVADDAFINDHDAAESGGEDDDEDGDKPKSEKKAGRRKIKIEFIQDKSRRHITFSKRKAGGFNFFWSHKARSLNTPFARYNEKGTAPTSILYRTTIHSLYLGLRAFHPHRYPSSSLGRIRDWLGVHIHYRQATTPRHPTRGQKSYSSMS